MLTRFVKMYLMFGIINLIIQKKLENIDVFPSIDIYTSDL